jgi:hypothetical protein
MLLHGRLNHWEITRIVQLRYTTDGEKSYIRLLVTQFRGMALMRALICP